MVLSYIREICLQLMLCDPGRRQWRFRKKKTLSFLFPVGFYSEEAKTLRKDMPLWSSTHRPQLAQLWLTLRKYHNHEMVGTVGLQIYGVSRSDAIWHALYFKLYLKSNQILGAGFGCCCRPRWTLVIMGPSAPSVPSWRLDRCNLDWWESPT